MDWHFDNQRAIYTQLVEQVERAVVSGQWPPGSKLPGVRDLAAEAGVNPNTMQRALVELESGGLVRAVRTSGRFVTENAECIAALRQALAMEQALQFVRNMRALGCKKEEIEHCVAQATSS